MLLFVLAVVCLSRASVSAKIHARDTQCYNNWGCFESHGNIPVPEDPSIIATVFRLHKRGTNHVYNLETVNYKSQLAEWASHFDATKNTKFVIHGFAESGSLAWILKLTAELLKKDDFNVIIADWGQGSAFERRYEHAAGNTYLVGKEIAMLITYLHDSHGLNYTDVHLIGHSLGAQVAGTAGHEIQTVGRITGLDPAGPAFTGTPIDSRLDATDADFVDVIHTDTSIFNIVSGFGTHDAVGDIDFYPNGGEFQPGCEEIPLGGASKAVVNDSGPGPPGVLTWCSHSRSHELFTESVNSICKFYGHKCLSADEYEAGNCQGCPVGGCAMMGYDADQTQNQTGTFYLSTSGKSPFCGWEYFLEVNVTGNMLHTNGEFILTLVGTHGKTEPHTLESKMYSSDHGQQEKHLIVSHIDIGIIKSVKLEFNRATDGDTILVNTYLHVHSVVVQPAVSAERITFCGQEQRLNAGQAITLTLGSVC